MKNGKVNAEEFADCLFGSNACVFEIPKDEKVSLAFNFPDHGEYLFTFFLDGETFISFRKRGKGEEFKAISKIENCSENSDSFYKMGIFCVFYADSKWNIAFSTEQVSRIWFE